MQQVHTIDVEDDSCRATVTEVLCPTVAGGLGRRALHPALHLTAFALAVPLAVLDGGSQPSGVATALLAGLAGAVLDASGTGDVEVAKATGLRCARAWLEAATTDAAAARLEDLWEVRVTDESLLTPLRRVCRCETSERCCLFATHTLTMLPATHSSWLSRAAC